MSTMHRFLPTIVILSILLHYVTETHGCELEQMGNGCAIRSGGCTCGFGCKSEFRYATNRECNDALTGRRRNVCTHPPKCQNGGSCLQIASPPGFKCLCEGTGYYGLRCERSCSVAKSPQYRGSFPYECIVI